MKVRSCIAIFLAISVNVANAEGGSCPAGYYPIGDRGISGCAPIPNYGSSSPGEIEAALSWEDRWGSIAADYAGGKFGVSRSLTSKDLAQAAALQDCVNEGGTACKVDLTYSNQCGSIAWGLSYAATARAPTLEEASSMALSLCGNRSTECKVYYSDCSYQMLAK